MGRTKSSTSNWIVAITGIVGLLATGLVLVIRYYEIQKARAEAEQAQLAHELARKEAKEKPQAKPESPRTTMPPVPVSSPKTDGRPSPPAAVEPRKSQNAFQPRSSLKTVLAVGHGKVDVTAKAVEERRIIITIIGHDFGNDLSPLYEWLGKTGDLFSRKIKELGLGYGNWALVSEARTFTVRDGVASLELTWEQK